jgi:hypothetical protein
MEVDLEIWEVHLLMEVPVDLVVVLGEEEQVDQQLQ